MRSPSPLTPDARPPAGKAGEYFAPRIANNSPPPPHSRRPGGYGGLEEGSLLEPMFSPAPYTPRKQGPSLVDRMDAPSPEPLGMGRRPSASERSMSGDVGNRPGTSASNNSSRLGSEKGPGAQRQNGYGGLGPSRALGDLGDPPLTPSRSDTFPRPSDTSAPPPRSPSAPPPTSRLHPDKPRPTLTPSDPDERVPGASERQRRPSRGPDTSRPPPPRSGVMRPTTPVVPKINLAEEFGVGNPYHTPSASSSSNESENSRFERRPSQASQASSRTSPPRSLSSRSGRKPSDGKGADDLAPDLRSSASQRKLNRPVVPPLKLSDRGYDPRIDPAVQNPRYGRGRPLPSPMVKTALFPPNELKVPEPSDMLSPVSAPVPSPQWTKPVEQINRLPAHLREPKPSQERPKSPMRNPGLHPSTSTRGNCKSCGLLIKGKSISSADGRLTGRYHKDCFVCSDCRTPFSSSTFYVLDDRPYCELHYHERNGSLCASCGKGIEGQYLEDESALKHHVGCFQCAKCRVALSNGYFEVNGKAYCEKDAWRLVQQPWIANGGGRSPGPSGPRLGLPADPRGHGPASGMRDGGRWGPRPTMEKRMTRLGMM
jgi:hypothetical protein